MPISILPNKARSVAQIVIVDEVRLISAIRYNVNVIYLPLKSYWTLYEDDTYDTVEGIGLCVFCSKH